MNRLLSNMNLSKEEMIDISSYLKPISLKKGDVFILEGKRDLVIGILQQGTLISTYVSEKGNIEISRIYSLINENIIVSNYESFYNSSFSKETIKAIEHTNLLVLTKNNLNKIIDKYPQLEKIIKGLSEKSYINCIERVKQLQSYSAKERIENYYKKYSNLFDIVNKQQMASYLGINRNDFTKFLKEIKKEI